MLIRARFLHIVLFVLDCRAYYNRKSPGYGEVHELTEAGPENKVDAPPAYEP